MENLEIITNSSILKESSNDSMQNHSEDTENNKRKRISDTLVSDEDKVNENIKKKKSVENTNLDESNNTEKPLDSLQENIESDKSENRNETTVVVNEISAVIKETKTKNRIRVMDSDNENDLVIDEENDVNASDNDKVFEKNDDQLKKDEGNSAKKKKSALRIIDSDSEEETELNIDKDSKIDEVDFDDENDINASENDNVFEKNDEQLKKDEGSSVIKKKSALRIIDSESEEETELNIDKHNKIDEEMNEQRLSNNGESEEEVKEIKKKKPIFKLIDSDSEDETALNTNDDSAENEIQSDNEKVVNKTKSRIKAMDSDSDENDPNAKKEEIDISRHKKPFKLIDTDSEEEPIVSTFDDDMEERITEVTNKKKGKPKKPVVPKEKKMTAKAALEQRKEIKSESQRMVRESNISLPYHKPKQRSLKDFLQNRPKFAIDMEISKPSVAIKMCTKKLDVVMKKIQEREKIVEEFFKSDSEDENVDGNTFEVPNVEATITEIESTDADKDAAKVCTDIDKVAVEEYTHADQAGDKECTDVNNLVDNNDIRDNEQKVLEHPVDVSMGDKSIHELSAKENNAEESNIKKQTTTDSLDSDKNTLSSLTNEVMMHSNDIQFDTPSEPSEKAGINISKDDSQLCTDDSEISIHLVPDDFDSNFIPNSEDFSAVIVDKEQVTEIAANPEEPLEITKETEQKSEDKMKTKESEEHVLVTERAEPKPEDKIKTKESEEHVLVTENAEPKPEDKMRKRLEKLGLANVTPRLSGGPNLVIDLDEGIAKPNEVTQLIERFMQHASKKKHTSHKVEFSIVSVTGDGAIQKEKVSLDVEEAEEPLAITETPGEKLYKLRTDLQRQIAQQKAQLWKQKLKQEQQPEENTEVHGKTLTDEEEDLLLGDDDDDSDEENDEVCKLSDDEGMVEKEAEEEPDEDNEEIDDDNIENEQEEDEVDGASDGDDENESESESEEEISPSKKTYSKILMPDDDSDEEDELDSGVPKTTLACEDEGLQLGQQRKEFVTPQKVKSDSKPEMEFTPVCHLTALQSLDTDKFLRESPDSAHTDILSEPSPLKGWQKKLFSDSDLSTKETQNEPELKKNFIPPVDPVEEEPPTTQDLLNICSGAFTGMTAGAKPGEGSNTFSSSVPDIAKSDKAVVETITVSTGSTSTNVINEEDDRLISQLLDEAEMNEFKKKFESPIVTPSQAAEVKENSSIIQRIRFDSDEDVVENEEEDDDENLIAIKGRKRIAIVDSDDEAAAAINTKGDEFESDDEDEEQNEDETIDLASADVEYDSEENEIMQVTEPEAVKKKIKMNDFYDVEAELSESEWGSEDEDERNLDYLETELGDEEKFDQNKLKSDLEKIHMRQQLDDDSRELKILQELLLENGEDHGSGRKRQFRWQNINNSDVNDIVNKSLNDDETAEGQDDDDNNEQQWRKQRFERELFLQKQSQSIEMEDENSISLSGSQLLKLGQRAVIKQNNTVITQKIEKQHAFLQVNKRGSFLTRSDQVLKRMAEAHTKVNTISGGVKQTKNFVFQSVVPTNVNADKKRKAGPAGTPAAIKKLRIDSLSPAVRGKMQKPNARKKQLFSTK